jgi:Domain of unknown function (DUF4136)
MSSFSLLISLSLVSTYCLAGDVKAFASKDADFSRYKTYQWLPPKVLTKAGIVENEPTVSPLIEKAVKQELAKIGLTEVSQEADLQVATAALTESVPQLEAVFFGSLDPELGTLSGANPVATLGRYNKQGSLAVNLIDTRTNKSAWAGIATRTLGKPSQNGKNIDKAVSDMFKKYPSKR